MPKEEPKEEPSWAPSAGVPKYDAPPSEVRKFIIDILHKHHEVDIQDAAKIAAKWTYSRGYDFLNYDIPRMNGILGENYGGIMRAHTRPVQYASDYEKELRKLRIQAGKNQYFAF